ncbi:TonB-dependent siderophore receptor [Albimonas pacifica]|nr:TonB-dependent siderophore receptor [Albimonas pacifica]
MLGGATLALVPAAGWAQETPAADPAPAEGEVYRLSPVLVDRGARGDDDARSVVAREISVGGKVATSIQDTPASISVVTQREIELRDADTIEEVLSYTPGIVTDYYGSDDRNDYFQIRGFDASTYRDGLTLGTMRGVREEPYAFERVEILKGANSTLFGPSEPGGSINYVSKLPRFEEFGEVYVQGGSFEHRELGFDFGDTIDADQTLAFRLTGKLQDAEREYAHSRDDEGFLMGGLTWEPTFDTSISLVADWLVRDASPNSGGYPLDRDYSRELFFGEPDLNRHAVERATVTLLGEHDFGGGFSLRGNVRYSDLTDDFGYVYLSDYPGRPGTVVDRFQFGSDSSAQELIGNLIGQYDRDFGAIDSSTLLGAEFRDASTSTSSFYGAVAGIDVANPVYTGAPPAVAPYLVQDQDYSTQALFVQQNLSFYDTIIVTGGVRHDWLDLRQTDRVGGAPVTASDDFAEFSFRGAVTWKVTDEVSTYVSYVESVSPPGIGVEPERGEQYEIGVKYAPDAFPALFSASVFDLTKNNVTIAVVQPDGAIVRQLIGESRARGFELEGKAEITETFSIFGGYTFLDTEVVKGVVRGVDVSGKRLASTPEHMASLWATYVVPGEGARGDLTFGFGARYVGAYYFNASNDNGRSDDAVLFDASIGYKVTENAELQVNVTNLMDEQNVVGRGTADYYNPGRTVMAKLRYVW